jgi:aquaporin TIP
MRGLGGKLLAEFVGTFALIFIGAGSIVAQGNEITGVTPGSGLITIALAHGLAIGTMVSAVGHVSGGHFNPAVTTGLWVARRIGSWEAVVYVVTQLAAGIAAAFVLRWVVPQSFWEPAALGATVFIVSGAQAIAIEAILTFFLVWVVFATAVDPEGSFNKVAGLAIGFVIAMDIMMGGPFTGASMNPARSLGPAVAGGEYTGIWVYFIGPVIGATLAAVAYDLGVLRRRIAAP